MYTIYQIKNKLNGKIYRGFTTQRPQKRWIAHKSQARTGKYKHIHLYCALRKYGPENFLFEILEQGHDHNYGLEVREPFLIAEIDPHVSYNMTPGGEGNRSYVCRAETGRKISEALRGKKKPPRSFEHAFRISKALTGKESPHKGKTQRIVRCPHCGVEGGYCVMGRHHFYNCKMI
jgi:group I intron endonuclease